MQLSAQNVMLVPACFQRDTILQLVISLSNMFALLSMWVLHAIWNCPCSTSQHVISMTVLAGLRLMAWCAKGLLKQGGDGALLGHTYSWSVPQPLLTSTVCKPRPCCSMTSVWCCLPWVWWSRPAERSSVLPLWLDPQWAPYEAPPWQQHLHTAWLLLPWHLSSPHAQQWPAENHDLLTMLMIWRCMCSNV